MLSMLQRWLIYFPTRKREVRVEDASLPAGKVHHISVRTDDGLELHGWHVLADGHLATDQEQCDRELQRGRLLVLFFSGNAANRIYRVEEIRVLTAAGADVFIFDYRGYAENAGSPSEAKLVADARVIWKYATDERNVASDRIVLFGESLGGGVTTRLAAERSQMGTPPAGVILRSTFSSLVDVGKYHYPWLPVRILLVDQFLSLEHIPKVTCPILQIHGARDTIVPISLGHKLFESAPETSANGLQRRFVRLINANHNDVLHVAKTELSRAVSKFLAQLHDW